MAPKSYDTIRVNIQLPMILKEEVEEYARASEESVSEFFRVSAKSRIEVLRRAEQERRLATAYDSMREDAEGGQDDWETVDVEGWE